MQKNSHMSKTCRGRTDDDIILKTPPRGTERYYDKRFGREVKGPAKLLKENHIRFQVGFRPNKLESVQVFSLNVPSKGLQLCRRSKFTCITWLRLSSLLTRGVLLQPVEPTLLQVRGLQAEGGADFGCLEEPSGMVPSCVGEIHRLVCGFAVA